MAFFAWFDAPPISAGLALIAAMLIFAIYVFDLIVSRAEFSRAKGTVTISHTRFGRGKTEVIKLGAIRKAFTMVSGTNAQVTGTMMDGGQKCPALELRQGKTVPLSAISNFNRSQEIAVQVVNEWLGRKPD
jgi:FtsP/CotA-like multicopper oxidase with cupredoxin domain